jgi:DNA-directed RNA polymerase specialized sigma24 family protein
VARGVEGKSCSEVEHAIDEWIFSERDRGILKRRLLDGITYERLAEEFDLSVRQVKYIVYKAQDRLFLHI